VSRSKIILLLIVFNLVSVVSNPIYANECSNIKSNPQIVLIVPGTIESSFWQEVTAIAKVVSRQLAIDLKLYYFQEKAGQRFLYRQFLDKVLEKEPQTEYLISYLINDIEQSILDVAKAHNVKVFTYNSPFTASLESRVGRPREGSNQHWIGHLYSDEISVGYDLANYIINEKKKDKQTINLLAINGKNNTALSKMREKGLIDRVNEDKLINLLQVINTDWSYKDARNKTKLLLKRFSEIDVIWCSSDTIARAVVDEINSTNPALLSKVKIGGIDWSEPIKPYITRSDVTVSFGGHIFDVAHLLVHIYDHHKGLTFPNDTSLIIKNNYIAMTAKEEYFSSIHQYEKLNFKSLSRCFTPGSNKSSYNLIDLLKSIN